ncbi:MAG TPA: hypothetical protein VNM48_03960 [Chloroflexota bacterium]|nr:hypothetical protein [Chloroflexota bacterium]
MPVLQRAEVYEHGYLVIRFTCPCGKGLAVNFTTAEHFDCVCGRRHYPVLRVLTQQQPKEGS